MKTTTRKLTFKRASLISAIIAGTPFLVLLIDLFFEVTDVITNINDIVFSISSGYPSLAWMISCIVFSWGIIRDGEHFPSIPKWVWCVLRIWTFLFAVFFLLYFVFVFMAFVNGWVATTEDVYLYRMTPCWLSVLMFCAGLVLCFHYMIWFWYLYKRPLPNTTVSCNSPWMKCIASVTILGVLGTTILAVLVAAYGIMYTKQHMSGEFMVASLIMYLSYIIIAPSFLSLCLFLQPIINRCANKQPAVMDSEQATDNTITDGDTEQMSDAQDNMQQPTGE